jgi:hypothetical protein
VGTLHPYFGALHDVIVPHDQFQAATVSAGDVIYDPYVHLLIDDGPMSKGTAPESLPQLSVLTVSITCVDVDETLLEHVILNVVSAVLGPVETLPAVIPPVEGLDPELATISHLVANEEFHVRIPDPP